MRKPDLPIFEIERPLLKTLTTQKRLVLTAPTGSGKSTQVPQMLLDSGLLRNGQVTVLQPRRLPTRMLAAWVAQARDVKVACAHENPHRCRYHRRRICRHRGAAAIRVQGR